MYSTRHKKYDEGRWKEIPRTGLWLNIIPGIAIALLTGLSSSLQSLNGYWETLTILIAVIIATSPYIVGVFREQKLRESQINTHIFTNNLKQFCDALLEKQQNETHHIRNLLQAGITLFPHNNLRAVYYTLNEIETEDNDKERKVALLLCSHVGRLDLPRLEFTPATLWGSHAIQCAQSHAAKPFTDIDRKATNINHEAGSVWQSFMIFPVRKNEEQLGALMIDSIEKIRWTTLDNAIGSLIAYALGECEQAEYESCVELNNNRPRASDLREHVQRLRKENNHG